MKVAFTSFKSCRKRGHPLVTALCIFHLTGFAAEVSRAQVVTNNEPSGRHVGVYTSTGIASYREDLIVPLGFHGPYISLGGVYTQESGTNLVGVRLTVGIGYLKNRYSHEAWVLTQDLRLSWLKKLKEYPNRGTFWGGISLPFQMNNLFFESWDEAHLYWVTSHGLAGAVQWEKSVSSRNRLSVRVEAPLFEWVSRPPTYRYDKQEPLNHLTYHYSRPSKSLHLETIDTYQDVFLQVVLKRKMGGSLMGAGFEFQYRHCSRPEDIYGFGTRLLFTYQWGLR